MKQNVVATLFLVNIKSRMQFIIHQWRWSQRFWFANPNGDFCSCRGGMQGPCRHWLFRLNVVIRAASSSAWAQTNQSE